MAAPERSEASTLLFAVEDMLADHRDFVRWWSSDEGPGSNWGGDRSSVPAGTLARHQIEADSGIKHWQVSRWSKALGIDDDHPDGQPTLVDTYRDAIIAAANEPSI